MPEVKQKLEERAREFSHKPLCFFHLTASFPCHLFFFFLCNISSRGVRTHINGTNYNYIFGAVEKRMAGLEFHQLDGACVPGANRNKCVWWISETKWRCGTQYPTNQIEFDHLPRSYIHMRPSGMGVLLWDYVFVWWICAKKADWNGLPSRYTSSSRKCRRDRYLKEKWVKFE